MKRLLDIVASFIGLIFLTPLFLLIVIVIILTSRGGVFYLQRRVGRYGNDFSLLKFRTMRAGSDKRGLLTIGETDDRITPVGKFLRKSKLDELPQLINVLAGDMSLVGPRPEVRKYVELYTEQQKRVLLYRPGITDVASIKYKDENEILLRYAEPEKAYIEQIMPDKLNINLNTIKESQSVTGSIKIIWLTFMAVFNKAGNTT